MRLSFLFFDFESLSQRMAILFVLSLRVMLAASLQASYRDCSMNVYGSFSIHFSQEAGEKHSN
jgi:hypothetical protein